MIQSLIVQLGLSVTKSVTVTFTTESEGGELNLSNELQNQNHRKK